MSPFNPTTADESKSDGEESPRDLLSPWLNHLISADRGFDALEGDYNPITNTASLRLDSIGRLLGGLATRRLQIGEQSLPAL